MGPRPRFLLAYATREGQTAKIAEEIENLAVHMDVDVDCYDVEHVHVRPLDGRYAGALIGGSIHLGEFEPELIEFISSHREELERMNASFFAVCLTEAEKGELARETVRGYLTTLTKRTGWKPAVMTAFGGALKYSSYGFVKRFLVRRVAAARGLPTDMSQDYELTNWGSVDAFAEDVIGVATGVPVDVKPVENDVARAGPL